MSEPKKVKAKTQERKTIKFYIEISEYTTPAEHLQLLVEKMRICLVIECVRVAQQLCRLNNNSSPETIKKIINDLK